MTNFLWQENRKQLQPWYTHISTKVDIVFSSFFFATGWITIQNLYLKFLFEFVPINAIRTMIYASAKSIQLIRSHTNGVYPSTVCFMPEMMVLVSSYTFNINVDNIMDFSFAVRIHLVVGVVSWAILSHPFSYTYIIEPSLYLIDDFVCVFVLP